MSDGPVAVTVILPTAEVVEAVVMSAGGPPGTPGVAATVSVGTTTTGVAGTNATVANTGTATAAVFDFTIPRGTTGAAGTGVPVGGTATQALTKIDSTDFNTQWVSIPSADTVSARLVSVSAELMSQIASTSAALGSADNVLSARITSAEAAAGVSVTSAKVQTASAAATSADAHANAVSVRVVSVSAELASLVGVASALASTAVVHANTASAAATSADAHANAVSIRLVSASAELTSIANIVSARAVSISSELASMIASGDAALSTRADTASALAGAADSHANVVSARAVSISAELASLIASGDAFLSARITSAEGITPTVSVTSAEMHSLVEGYSTIATAAGTTALSANSPPEQFFTGTTTQTVTLPDVTGLVLGRQYLVNNDSTGIVTVQSSGANTIVAMAAGSAAVFTCILTTGTTAASWSYRYSGTGGATSVTSAKVQAASAAATSADAHANTVSARAVSISAELASLVQIASAAATSADAHANTVSVRVVSVSAELASLVQIASAAATSADVHANTVSVRAVSISNELGSLMASADAALSLRVTSAAGLAGGGPPAFGFAQPFVFDNGTTNADPGIGRLRFNNATIGSVTEVYVNNNNSLGSAIGPLISSWYFGSTTFDAYLVITKKSDPSVYAQYSLTTTPTINTGYRTLPSLIFRFGSGTFANNDDIVIDLIGFNNVNVISARLVSVSSELVSLFTSVDNKLSASIQTASAAATSADAHANTASAAATSADAHANTVSVRVVSVSAELASLVQIASAAATSADAHANTVSIRAVSISNELGSLLASASAALETHANTVSARVVSVSAELMSQLASTSAALLSAVQGFSTIATAAATTSISVGSPPEFFLTGSTTQTFQLPVVSTLVLGRQFMVKNDSSGVVTVQSSGGNTIVAMAAGSVAVFTCIAITGTGTASWSYVYSNTASDVVSARVVSVSAELASLVQIASAAATSADAHANTVSARAVSISAELVSMMNSADNRLSTRIDGVVGGAVSAASAEIYSIVQGYSTIATAAGTTSISAGSPPEIFFTGSTTQIFQLPDVTTLVLGKQYLVKNDSTGSVTVQSSGANTIVNMVGGTAAVFTCIAITGTGTASWSYSYSNAGADVVSARVVSVSAELASLLVSAVARRAINTANQAGISASTGLTVSGVSVALTSAQTYTFQFQIPFTLSLTNGVMVKIVGPATNTFIAHYQIPGAVGNAAVLPAANGVTPFQAETPGIGTVVSTASITLAATTLMIDAWGTINPSANGSLKFVVGPNTSGSTPLVVLKGANVMVWRIA